MHNISRPNHPIPTLTTDQMIEVDRLMIEKYHIELIQMMENTGRGLALLEKERFLDKKRDAHVVILAGTGGNGGGALVAARRLINWGFDVNVIVTHPERMTSVSRHQLEILQQMGGAVDDVSGLVDFKQSDLIIDGIIGYSLKDDPPRVAKEMIDWANQQEGPTLSLDTPSGLDLAIGTIHDPVIQADATMTLALPKMGLMIESTKEIRGELYLADISVPPKLYLEPTLSIKVDNIFRDSEILRID